MGGPGAVPVRVALQDGQHQAGIDQGGHRVVIHVQGITLPADQRLGAGVVHNTPEQLHILAALLRLDHIADEGQVVLALKLRVKLGIRVGHLQQQIQGQGLGIGIASEFHNLL